jgi:hypothetical protein
MSIIVNNIVECVTRAEVRAGLSLLHYAIRSGGIHMSLSFVCGTGEAALRCGDDIEPNNRWWCKTSRWDRQLMLPFPDFNTALITDVYNGSGDYYEVEVRLPTSGGGRMRRSTILYFGSHTSTQPQIRALKVHGLTRRNITTLQNAQDLGLICRV